MKLWDIVKTIGSGIIKEVIPGGGMIVGAINEFLPDDKKLPDTATGEQIESVVSSLPPMQRAELLEKEFDVDITQIKESHSTVRAMLESDAKNPHTTRPYIAKHAFHVIAFASIVTIAIWAYGVMTENSELVTAVTDGWPFVVAVVGPLVTLLWAYFGILKNEHRDRLSAAGGNSPSGGITGMLSSILKRR